MTGQKHIVKPEDQDFHPKDEGLDAMICSPSSDDLPTPHPSGAWSRSDYVREYEKRVAERDRARTALDAIYNHNAACRAAVIQYYGLNHDHVMIPLDNSQDQERL